MIDDVSSVDQEQVVRQAIRRVCHMDLLCARAALLGQSSGFRECHSECRERIPRVLQDLLLDKKSMLSRLFNCAPVLFTVGGSGAQFQRVNVLGVILDLLLPSIHDAITAEAVADRVQARVLHTSHAEAFPDDDSFTTLGSFKNMCLNSNLGLDDLCAKALAERSRALLPMFRSAAM